MGDPTEVSAEPIEGGSKGVGGMRLHQVETVSGSSDDCWPVHGLCSNGSSRCCGLSWNGCI